MAGLKHILLVEDDPNDIELITAGFSGNHLANRIKAVRDGEEALDYLFCRGPYAGREEGMPAMVLLDLKLLKVDGLEVLRQIKTDPRLRLLPVVILSSSMQDKDIKEAYRLGANSYVVKPIDFHPFIEAIQLIGSYWGIVAEPPWVR